MMAQPRLILYFAFALWPIEVAAGGVALRRLVAYVSVFALTILALIAVSRSAQAHRHLHLPLPRWKQPRSSHDRTGGQCSGRVHARREQDRARIVPRAKRTLDIYTMIADGTTSPSLP